MNITGPQAKRLPRRFEATANFFTAVGEGSRLFHKIECAVALRLMSVNVCRYKNFTYRDGLGLMVFLSVPGVPSLHQSMAYYSMYFVFAINTSSDYGSWLRKYNYIRVGICC